MDKHLHDTPPTRGREHKSNGAGTALVKVAVYALLVAVVVSLSVPLGRNNAQLPAIAHAAPLVNTPTPTATPNTALNGAACPSTDTCYAVGDGGTLLVSTDGGQHWTDESQNIPVQNGLHGIACPSTSI